MGNHTAHTRERQGRTRTITGKHVVRAAFVGGFTMGHASTNRNLVGDRSGLLPHLIDVNAFDVGGDRIHRAAVLNRGVGLGVKRFLMRHSTGEVQENDGFGCPFL